MKGGPRKGSGRPPRHYPRDKTIAVKVTQTEWERLTLLAERWNVPLATAAYGLLADQLSRVCNRVGDQLPHDLVEGASLAIRDYARKLPHNAIRK